MSKDNDSGNKKGHMGGLEQTSDAARQRKSGQEDNETQRTNRASQHPDRSTRDIDEADQDTEENLSTNVGRKGGSDQSDKASRKSHS